jgi:hypothetical protein
VTAAISIMPEITRAVGVPRSLVVPFGLGCPFGSPRDTETQMRVLRALLALCGRTDVPVMQTFDGGR